MAETSVSAPDAMISNTATEGALDSLTDGIDAAPIEATELSQIRSNYALVSSNYQGGSHTPLKKSSNIFEHITYNIQKFWRLQVRVVVPHESCRDHLALERTYLAYLRTSLALSMLGIIVAQLFRLQHAPNPSGVFGFYVLGKPLSCICQGAAIYTLFIGAFRTWRLQNAIVRGKAITGGFEIILMAAGIFAVLLMFFVLLLAVNISKEHILH
ncbi:hypothetical protein B0O99DRAFT_102823 [Bisporella sp. PMI_857]|nr:hypothetical protein B0O99DRAFT_102823 [Bisporella sp. PMI_857]